MLLRSLPLSLVFSCLTSSLPAQVSPSFSYLAALDGTNGSGPGAIVQASNGSLFGVAPSGGDARAGTLYKVTLEGAIARLISFDGPNGAGPSVLKIGSDGNLYGATVNGGSNNLGVIYKMTQSGDETVLHSFRGPDGSSPFGLVEGSGGVFYGITSAGGNGYDGEPSDGSGVIFKFTSSGGFAVIHKFPAGDGNEFYGALALGTDGNVYGTGYTGGGNGWGFIFQFTPAGDYTPFASFVGGNGGGQPFALISGGNGYFYGTTGQGGTNSSGILFQMAPSGALKTLASFAGGNSQPSSLVRGKDGSFYGSGDWAFFAVSPSGVTTTLYDIGPAINVGPVVLSADGNLYGTIQPYYTPGYIFKITPLSYACLFYETNVFDLANSGSLDFTVGIEGNFTGVLKIANSNYNITGQFDLSALTSTVVLHRRGLPDLTLNLQIADSNSVVTGSISNETDTAQVFGNRIGEGYSAQNPAPQAGKYSMTLLSDSDGTSSPGDGSFGRVTISNDGTISLTGMLSDNTPINGTSSLSSSGQWPVDLSLYGGKGSLVGWISFTNQPSSRFDGNLRWVKSGGASGAYYHHGFTNTVTAVGAILTP
jgi:uncharacterized repeat protein (TIGR03803 family)